MLTFPAWALVGTCIGLLILVFLAALVWASPRQQPLTAAERRFKREPTGNLHQLPWLLDDKDDVSVDERVDLSVVVPAFNEEARLPAMLDATLSHLDTKRNLSHGEFSFEVLVVDDGSRDGTADVALAVAEFRPRQDVRVLSLPYNRGKGGAVTQGVQCARGRVIMFADADGATLFEDVDAMLELVHSGADVVIGSRAHMVSTDAVVKRSVVRNLLMHGFHAVVYLLCAPGVRDIKDTQCGFKMFTRSATRLIFPGMHVGGWIFDIEVLHRAALLGLSISEVPVTWSEVDGSKMSLLRDSVRMALDLLIIRANYTLGLWRASDGNGSKSKKKDS